MIRLFDKNIFFNWNSISNGKNTVKEKNKAKGKRTVGVRGKEDADLKIWGELPPRILNFLSKEERSPKTSRCGAGASSRKEVGNPSCLSEVLENWVWVGLLVNLPLAQGPQNLFDYYPVLNNADTPHQYPLCILRTLGCSLCGIRGEGFGLFNQHDRNLVFDFIDQTARFTDQTVFGLVQIDIPFTFGAGQDFQKFLTNSHIHSSFINLFCLLKPNYR
jgi:hypothetical protein